jgi:GrpB-like predicted nucleotidyltransferase (UPF0157 family)/8-oxo-dGTP pyrophosphatase MutT (NUDIX family)
MPLGLASNRVDLFEDHAAWSHDFSQESRRIAEALHPHILGIEHVGSTAIPGVPAKPILDLLIEVHDFDEARVCIAPLQSLGYEYRGEFGIPRRHYFVRGSPRTHHVHMLEIGTEPWRTTLGFRDALRARPELAVEYRDAKLGLVARYTNERAAYQQAKDQVVARILHKISASLAPVEKVLAYITNGERFAVFSEPDFPQVDLQVPGGSVEPGESLPEAVLREAREETGLASLELLRLLGSKFYFSPKGKIVTRHYFHLIAHGPVSEQWEHWENFPHGGDPPIRMHFHWAGLTSGVQLAGDQAALLHAVAHDKPDA